MHTNAVVTRKLPFSILGFSVVNNSCIENNAPWGPAQISSRTIGASSYSYDDTAGQGTFSYIVGMSSNSDST
jgi:hypothetical protein